MAAITAGMVKELRERTDLPMMECKQALSECQGEMDAALEWLRKKHKGKLAERSGRETGEGRIGVYINPSRTVGGLVELQCESAPVAGNELFVNLANAFAGRVAAGKEASPDPEQLRHDPEMDAKFTDVFGRLRENMNLRACRKVTGGHVWAYVHHDGKSGVMVALNAAPKSDKNVAADLCMHTLFTKPLAIDRSGVSADVVARVRREAVEIAKAEGKPDNIVEKIADGKVNAFYAERVLLEQLHVKTDDYGKKKVGDVLKEAGVSAVTDLAILRVGA